MPYEKHFGTHSFHLEEPDLHVLRLRGTMLGADVEEIIKIPRLGSDPERYHLLLIDVSGIEHIDASSRKVGMKSPHWGEKTKHFYAAVGMNFGARIGIDLFVRATNFMRGWKQVTMRHFDTEAEARVWLLEMRESMQRQPS